jgi:NAD-dependent SIR2 family protein deacetylase
MSGLYLLNNEETEKQMTDQSQVNVEGLSSAALFSIETARERIDGKRVFVLTGAGLSTDSGIPDYRGQGRVAKHPMTYDTFMGSELAQKRYWARSYVGWSRISSALPNPGHVALAKAETQGRISALVTQNVDGLHQEAGSKSVIDLHGRLDRVVCMGCKDSIARIEMDSFLKELNPGITKDVSVEFTPDGDAEVEGTENFIVPSCTKCNGVYKPDVVFFGESVPSARVELALSLLEDSDILLVAGTSLTVNSGYRFAKQASKTQKPIVVVNLGPTRADHLANAKIEANTSLALERLLVD